MPLASTFILSKKKNKEAYVEPVIENGGYCFTVKAGTPPQWAQKGTKLARGANFQCVMSGVVINDPYIKGESMAGRMGERLMAIVAEGDRGRVYLSPTAEHEETAQQAAPEWKPDQPMNRDTTNLVSGRGYGFFTWADLFTDRQMVALTTFSDLVGEARERIRLDAAAAGLPDDGVPLREGGSGATAYAEAVSVFLGLSVSRLTDICNAFCRWQVSRTQVRNLFGRQAIPMMWDYAENNVFGGAAGDFDVTLGSILNVIRKMMNRKWGKAEHCNVGSFSPPSPRVISTDRPTTTTLAMPILVTSFMFGSVSLYNLSSQISLPLWQLLKLRS